MKNSWVVCASFLSFSFFACSIIQQSPPIISTPAPVFSAQPILSPEQTNDSQITAIESESEGLQQFLRTTYCEPVHQTISKNHFDYLSDIVVSNDGKTIYITYLRDRFLKNPSQNFNLYEAFRSYGGIQIPIRKISNQIIYQLKDNERVPLEIAGGYPESCHLIPEIEKDSQGNIYLTKVNFNEAFFPPLEGYTLFQYAPSQDMFKKVASMDAIVSKVGDAYEPSRLPAFFLSYLHIPPGDLSAFYYKLEASANAFKPSFIYKHYLNGSSRETLLSNITVNSGQIKAFTVPASDKLFYGDYLVSPPYPVREDDLKQSANQEADNVQWKQLFDSQDFIPSRFRTSLDQSTVYVSDSVTSHSIWKIDVATHVVTRFVGTGTSGYTDDQGSKAAFNGPAEMDVDAAGNLYVLDVGNHAVRKITPSGVVTTLFKGET